MNELARAMIEDILTSLLTGEGMTAEEAEQMRQETEAPRCTQCGACCRQAPCYICYMLYGEHTNVCPLLTKRDGTYHCRFIERARGKFTDDSVRLVLSIGCGCHNPSKKPY